MAVVAVVGGASGQDAARARTARSTAGRSCRDPRRYADHVEFAYVDDAAHFLTDDAPAAVAGLALDSFDRAA